MRWPPLLALTALLAPAGELAATSFVIASGSNPEIVAHPPGYTGSQSGEILIDVCLDPSMPAAAEIPTKNVIATFNRFLPTLGNRQSASSVGIPGFRPDFESVLLHELGHCLGLGHNTLGPSELGVGGTSDPRLYYTISTAGANATFETSAGSDNVRASRDDGRGDDVNLHWFRKGVNDPFAAPSGRIDRVTYGVLLADLPAGHHYVEAATAHDPCSPGLAASTSLLRGHPPTQSIMMPIICLNNVYRDLAPSDVATLRVARAGADGDELAAGDNYRPLLRYIGVQSACTLRIRYQPGAGFAFCQFFFSGSGNNRFISSGIASFEPPPGVDWWFNPNDGSSMQLSVSKTGAGSGTVSSAPGGINCGGSCSASFALGSTVTLTATPSSGSVFAGWSGDCAGTGSCTLAMHAPRQVTAQFDAGAPQTLNVTKSGAGFGFISSSPAGISCGGQCSAAFPGGSSVTLTATPLEGSSFTGWSGDCTGSGVCTLLMNSTRNVTANFAPPPPPAGLIFRNGFE